MIHNWCTVELRPCIKQGIYRISISLFTIRSQNFLSSKLDGTDYKQRCASVCSDMYFCTKIKQTCSNNIIFSTILQRKQNKHIAIIFFTFASFKCFYFGMLSLSYQYNNGKLTKKCVHNSENKTHGTDHGESDVVLCSDFLAGAGPWDPMVPEGGAVNPLRGGGQGVIRLSGRGRGHGPGRPYRVGAHGHYMVMMLIPSRSQH